MTTENTSIPQGDTASKPAEHPFALKIKLGTEQVTRSFGLSKVRAGELIEFTHKLMKKYRDATHVIYETSLQCKTLEELGYCMLHIGTHLADQHGQNGLHMAIIKGILGGMSGQGDGDESDEDHIERLMRESRRINKDRRGKADDDDDDDNGPDLDLGKGK